MKLVCHYISQFTVFVFDILGCWSEAYGITGYKFDDEKVSPVRREQITALEGGGEDSVAYILLYRYVNFVSFRFLSLDRMV